MDIVRYSCPCCGYKTLTQKPPGTYEICDVCYWEDDRIQYNDPDYEGGANNDSLRTAQKSFQKRIGINPGGRLPESIKDYVYEGFKDVSSISRMPISEMIKIFYAVNSPVSKILDIYGGMLEIENSNYVFCSDELEHFLSEEDICDYFILTRRKSYVKVPNGLGRINELLNLCDEDAGKMIEVIRERFVKSINEQCLRRD